MKQLKLLIITASIFLASFSTPVVVADDFLMVATALCEYTKANDRNKIRKKLRRSKMKLRSIYEDIKCNDKTLYKFAIASNADEVMKFYEKKIKQSKL